MNARLTKHQKEVLLRLARLSGFRKLSGGWVHEKNCGSPSGLHHLYRKGYAELEERSGPRGGVHHYYRPTDEGWKLVEKDTFSQVERDMPMGEIDTRLIEARRGGRIVRIFVGPKRAEYRGVPGEVARDEDGVLRMQFGMRRVALMGIARVES